MTPVIIVVFLLGYFLIATESVMKVNKAAIALVMCVACWTLYALGNYEGDLNTVIQEHLGEASTTLFFLMGAMTIVEIVDQHGGFNPVRKVLLTRSKRSLLWKMGILTFFLSAVLDNLTTTIVMIMILRKLVSDHNDRLIYASLIIIAANSGGAFSPIGDVTTIMIWNKQLVTAGGVISELFIPSIVSMVLPCFLLQYRLKGNLGSTEKEEKEILLTSLGRKKRTSILILGVGGLCCVPIFHSVTGLPPFIGILCVLGLLWCVTEIFYRKQPEDDKRALRVTHLLGRVDMSTILFFLGILMAVSVLAQIGTLRALGEWLDATVGNHYLVTGSIGVLSSIVDNVPLVAGSMDMYEMAAAGDMAQDGLFWQLLAYCAGVGGSMLIIGSAAGVVAMGLERITFGWYMKHITWIAFVGYIAGILVYFVEKTIIG